MTPGAEHGETIARRGGLAILPPSLPPPSLPSRVGACHSLQPTPGLAVLPLRVSSLTLPVAAQVSLPNCETALASNTSLT